MDRLILLSEETARRAYFDTLSCRALFRLLAFCVLVALGLLVWMVVETRYLDLLLPLGNLVLIRALYLSQERDFFARHYRAILLGFLVVQGVIWRTAIPYEAGGFRVVDFLLPLMLLLFRLPSEQLWIPLTAFWTWSVGQNVALAALTEDTELSVGALLLHTTVTITVAMAVRHWTRQRRLAFLIDWRRELRRDQDRRRMREEIDDARRIQLSMLPRAEPAMGWLDVAGISIPASEVGGDYYGYFKISDQRLVVTIADVAGHGVASGLVLSGVRAGLHLLRESGDPPVDVVTRLDRMVRETSGTRMFVALLYIDFDRDAASMTVCAAGHPPVIHCQPAHQEIDEILLPSLPLGTSLERSLEQRTLPLNEGDVFVLSSDGIAETVNAAGEVYGDQRMRQCLRRIPADLPAKEIRDRLLSDVWSFKADGEQTDDITIVVAKVRSL